MLKKLVAPLFVLSVFFSVLAAILLNFGSLTEGSEANQPYFVKPLLASNLIVVEPNYGHFYNPYRSTEGDSSGEILRQSLDRLAQDYEIAETKMISFERKGQMIPNLYVFLKSANEESQLADASIVSPES